MIFFCSESDQSSHIPLQHRYLLLSAYMASYNAPSTDKRYFCKQRVGVKKRRTESTVSQLHKSETVNQHELGPKTFPLSRWCGIYRFITDEEEDSHDGKSRRDLFRTAVSDIFVVFYICYLFPHPDCLSCRQWLYRPFVCDRNCFGQSEISLSTIT